MLIKSFFSKGKQSVLYFFFQSIKDLGLEEMGELSSSESKGSLNCEHSFEVVDRESLDCMNAGDTPDAEDSRDKKKGHFRWKKGREKGEPENETKGLGEEEDALETLLKKMPHRKKDMGQVIRQQLIELHGKNELIKEGRKILDQITAERQRNLERIEEKEQVIEGKEFAIQSLTQKVGELSQQREENERDMQDKEKRVRDAEEKLALTYEQLREQETLVGKMQQTIEELNQQKDAKRRNSSLASFCPETRVEMDSLKRENERYKLQIRDKDGNIDQKEKLVNRLKQDKERLQLQMRESERSCLEKQFAIDRLHREKERGIMYVKKLEFNCMEKQNALEKSREENRNCREQVEQKEQLLSEKQRDLERTERRRTELANRVETLEGQLQHEQASRQDTVATLQVEKRSCEERLRQVQRELETQRRLSRSIESESGRARRSLDILRQEQPWMISKKEITITEKVLGTGAWGRVMEGTFRGTKVAVKEIHEVIQSAHNRFLFDREITFASIVRHPCILQFLGVADYGSNNPLLVTELMDMSLSEVMTRERVLGKRNMLIIGLDIANGLNYLHCFRPNPIIHRDVNCGNVMVWRQGDKWRGKLCDFGSADFVSNDMSINPGNPFYSAPEAGTPQQSPKVSTVCLELG